MARTHERGRRGEAIAARYLESEGWEILDRNWRAGHGEIDLVVRLGDLVAFVEVKTRGCGGDPLEGITRAKRREVERAARRWILERVETGEGVHANDGVNGRCLSGIRFRFDAVSVRLSPGGCAEVHHLADAWWIGD